LNPYCAEHSHNFTFKKDNITKEEATAILRGDKGTVSCPLGGEARVGKRDRKTLRKLFPELNASDKTSSDTEAQVGGPPGNPQAIVTASGDMVARWYPAEKRAEWVDPSGESKMDAVVKDTSWFQTWLDKHELKIQAEVPDPSVDNANRAKPVTEAEDDSGVTE
jgi:hypothetical protein